MIRLHDLRTGIAALALAFGCVSFAPFALAAGLFTRIAALAVGVDMLVAVLMVHETNGFFMNWYGAQKGEGFEYHLLVIGIVLALVVQGAGRWSVDHLIAKQTGEESETT